MKKYSKQREAIKECLKMSKAHPNAMAVYEEVRKILPNISLGTVYRNLGELQESGEILNLSLSDSKDRFDGDTSPHIHFYCRKCNKIFEMPIESDYGKALAGESGFTPDSSVYVVYGLCKECYGKE